MRIIIFPLFVLTIFVSVIFLKLGPGVPFRTLLLMAVFGLVVCFYKRHLQYFVFQHAYVTLTFGFMALLGSILSVMQGMSIAEVFQENLRQILQPFMMLVCTYVICYVAGVRAVAGVLLAVTAVSAIVALAQFVHLEPAWKLREIIGSIQNDPAFTQAFIRTRTRAMGLAFSPIEFSYIVAMAYIVSLLMFQARVITDRSYHVLLAGLFLTAVVIETRSLLLGMLVSELVRILAKGSVRSFLLVAGLLLVGFAGYSVMQDFDSRIVSVEDQSAAGRQVLYLFGLRLFLDNIMGLGWGFSPQDYAWLYWEHLTEFGKPQIIFRLNLHNAFLLFLIIYGVVGLVPAILLILAKPMASLRFIVYFNCFLIHSFFHNKGIFLASVFFWFGVGVFLYLRDVGYLNPAMKVWARPVLHGRRRMMPGLQPARAGPPVGP